MFCLFSDFIGAIKLDLRNTADWPDQVWFDVALQDRDLARSVQLDCSGLSDCALAKKIIKEGQVNFKGAEDEG